MKGSLKPLAEKTGAFEANFTIKTDEFTKEGLAKYDLIVFNNCTHVQKAFSEETQRKVILGFIREGKAFVGFHSASYGGMPQWQEYTEMIGGCFAGHPWNAGGTWPFTVEDKSHVLSKISLGELSFFLMKFISIRAMTERMCGFWLVWIPRKVG